MTNSIFFKTEIYFYASDFKMRIKLSFFLIPDVNQQPESFFFEKNNV